MPYVIPKHVKLLSGQPNSRQSGKWYCTKCASQFTGTTKMVHSGHKHTPKIRSDTEFKAWLRQNLPSIKILGEYKNAKTPIRMHCTKCQKSFKAAQTNVLRWTACLGCLPYRSGVPKKHLDYEASVKKYNPDVVLIGKYIKAHSKCKYKCVHCSHKWMAYPINIRRGTKCPVCSGKKRDSLIKGIRYSTQGYEHLALRWVLTHTTIKPNDIITDEKPIIKYYDVSKDKIRKYIPDFQIKKTIVEVKSTFTAGLLNGKVYYDEPEIVWKRLKAKAKATLAAGYKFDLYLMKPSGARIPLPNNWMRLSRKKVASIASACGD